MTSDVPGPSGRRPAKVLEHTAESFDADDLAIVVCCSWQRVDQYVADSLVRSFAVIQGHNIVPTIPKFAGCATGGTLSSTAS